ncbi:MAG: hypothetical protein AAF649_06470 [Verrucomicrobiota bacterium]
MHVAAGMWYLLLVIIGLMPVASDGPDLPHLDKVLHWGAYAVFGALLFVNSKSPNWYLGPACALAMLQEATHLVISERHFEWLDWLANCAGIISAWLVVRPGRKIFGIGGLPQS